RAQASDHRRRGPARVLHRDGRGARPRLRSGRDDLAPGGGAQLRRPPPVRLRRPGAGRRPSVPRRRAIRARGPGAAATMTHLVLAVALLATVGLAHAAAPAPSVVKRVLPNGLTVIVRSDEGVGVVAASLQTRAGSLFETAETAGITNFLHRVMVR